MTRSHSLLMLGSTHGSAVEEGEDEDEGHPRGIDEGGDQQETVDRSPRDAFERVAMLVKAPGKSLRAAGGGRGYGRRVAVRNCQTWLRDVVQELVGEDMLKVAALDVVDGVEALKA